MVCLEDADSGEADSARVDSEDSSDLEGVVEALTGFRQECWGVEENQEAEATEAEEDAAGLEAAETARVTEMARVAETVIVTEVAMEEGGTTFPGGKGPGRCACCQRSRRA